MDDDKKHRLRDAAIDAEFETGRREPTRTAALRQSVKRMARITGASFVVIIGIILLPLPGPGMVVIAIGLAMLSRDVAWADRALQRVRERLPQDADGKIPRSSIVTMVVIGLATMTFSLWWTLVR
jgi:uncharacterized protein (TIGR02611 family)